MVGTRFARRRWTSALRASSLIAAFTALGACSSNPTQVIVLIDADDEVRALVDEVRAEVFALESAEDTEGKRVFLGSRPAGSWPIQHVLTPENGDATRRYRVSAAGLRSDLSIATQTQAMSGYVSGQTRVLRLFLQGGACLDRACPPGFTCIGTSGECGETPVIDPERLPRTGEDASVDGGAGDMGDADAGPSCIPGGACELAEDQMDLCVSGGVIECEDDMAVCVPQLITDAETPCRTADAENPCDVDDFCDGTSPSCVDLKAPENQSCGDADAATFCFDGDCRACVEGEACSPGECRLGVRRCSGGPVRCEETGFAPETTVCRETAGPCDVAELCDGAGTCPPDTFVSASEGAMCRESTGACDVAELCSGMAAECPPDRLAAADVVCSPGDGQCVLPTLCTGTDATCPSEINFAPDTTECAPAEGECDAPDFCSGVSDECRPFFADAGLSCGSGLECDGAGACVNPPNCGEECTVAGSNNQCRTGIVQCNADGSEQCIVAGERPDGTSCTLGGALLQCENAPVCRAGRCERVYRAGEPCGAAPSSSMCRGQAFCEANRRACPPPPALPNGTDCGPEGACFASQCIDGTCLTVPANEGAACAPGSECVSPSICMDLNCVPERNTDGDRCGDPSAGVCDGADSCLDGVCQTNEFPEDTSCGPVPASECGGGRCRDASCLVTFNDGEPCGSGFGLCASGLCGTLLISEIGRSNSDSLPDFVELYNASTDEFRAEECQILVDDSVVFELNGRLPSGSFFLLGSREGDLGADALAEPEFTFETVGSVTLRCFDETGERRIIDRVAWGGRLAPEGEGQPLPPFPAPSIFGPSPEWSSWERKACLGSTPDSMRTIEANSGNAFDTQDNNSDFVSVEGEPQNARSDQESPNCDLAMGI